MSFNHYYFSYLFNSYLLHHLVFYLLAFLYSTTGLDCHTTSRFCPVPFYTISPSACSWWPFGDRHSDRLTREDKGPFLLYSESLSKYQLGWSWCGTWTRPSVLKIEKSEVWIIPNVTRYNKSRASNYKARFLTSSPSLPWRTQDGHSGDVQFKGSFSAVDSKLEMHKKRLLFFI